MILSVLLVVLRAALFAAGPQQPDPRWVFYSDDPAYHSSPWYAGVHREMVPFGCTPAPYYVPDPRCAGGHGFHHGIDVAMPCGTRLYAAVRGRVVVPGSLGPAYGTNPLLIRTRAHDIVVGHTRTTFVAPGDRVRPGEPIALASDNGAPDGCHLHLEQRSVGGGLATATSPRRLLGWEGP